MHVKRRLRKLDICLEVVNLSGPTMIVVSKRTSSAQCPTENANNHSQATRMMQYYTCPQDFTRPAKNVAFAFGLQFSRAKSHRKRALRTCVLGTNFQHGTKFVGMHCAV